MSSPVLLPAKETVFEHERPEVRMKVAFYQNNPRYGEIEYNLFTALNALGSTRADLYVLPELFSTGYLFGSKKELAGLAEPVPSGPTTKALIEFCRGGNCALVAGIAEASGKKYYNTAVLAGPRGLLGKYRKTHLFNMEKLWFEPGNSGLDVWTYRGTRIGLMICFDWVFPEATRILALKGAEIVCHPSNLVLPYCQPAMVTRSIENRVFTITANRVGAERRGKTEFRFSGMSQITDPGGRILVRAPKTGETVMVASIDPAGARKKNLTPRNHVLRDRRPEFYKLLTKKSR